MVNLEHKLTVDDLIIEYTVLKLKNGYEPKYTINEFMDFLSYFKKQMEVEDVLKDGEKLFNRFFERKNKYDWNSREKDILIPHIDMEYKKEIGEYVLSPNYRLSAYDSSIITTCFMDDETTKKIRNIINEYLEKLPKRKIDTRVSLDDESLFIGKYVTAEIINNIWESYINKHINNNTWPTQCTDLNKYLLEVDLAEIIGLKSIKKDLLEFYDVISKRIAVLYKQDKNLKISTNENSYLANSNYKLLTKGYEKMFEIAFYRYGKSMKVDFGRKSFIESHVVDHMEDETKITETKIGNDKVKKIIKSLEN